jgi:hypothetical protein
MIWVDPDQDRNLVKIYSLHSASRNNTVNFQLELDGLQASSHLRDIINSHVMKLESRFGRLVTRRLVIRAPGAHHRIGEAFAVSIELTLPARRMINVAPVMHTRDPRQANVIFAVNDAFRRATAQLRRQSQLLQEKTKSQLEAGPRFK